MWHGSKSMACVFAILVTLAPGFNSATETFGKDINDDGRTDAVDVQLVINATLGLPIEGDADVNGDQRIDAADVQITIAIALGTTQNLFPKYGLKIFDQGVYGDIIGVGIFLIRGPFVSPSDPAASAIDGRIEFDQEILAPIAAFQQNYITVVPGAKLRSWYNKGIQAVRPERGVITFVVSGDSYGMTTYDDQIPDTPVQDHVPSQQENPFLLGTIFFHVTPGATGETEFSITNVSAADAYAITITELFGASGAVFDLDAVQH